MFLAKVGSTDRADALSFSGTDAGFRLTAETTHKTVRAHLLVHGRVHGVGYRYACAATAGSLGIAGWVRNRPDGAVEAVFEGRDEQVGAAVEWCRHGPSVAHVTGVDVVDEPPEGLDGFTIR